MEAICTGHTRLSALYTDTGWRCNVPHQGSKLRHLREIPQRSGASGWIPPIADTLLPTKRRCERSQRYVKVSPKSDLTLSSTTYQSSVGVATEAERNQALGHSRSEIFLRYYIQQQVRADVQSAFLGVPARQALFKAVGRMSLDRDPRVPQSLDAAQRADVKRDPRLVSLVCERADLRKQLIRDHGMIKDGVGTSTYVKYRAAQRDHRNMEIALLEDKLKVVKDAFFQSIDTREIEAQLRPRDKEIRSDGELLAAALAAPPSYTFDERARLALALFENTSAADDALTNRTRRCAAIEDMANLTFKIQTPRLDKERVWTDIADIIAEELEPLCVQDEPDLYPKVCPSTVCLFCLGNENMTSISRIHSYARKDSLSRHVKVSHLRYIDPLADISCPHPACDSVCKGHNGFKAHAGRAHNVWHA